MTFKGIKKQKIAIIKAHIGSKILASISAQDSAEDTQPKRNQTRAVTLWNEEYILVRLLLLLVNQVIQVTSQRAVTQ